MALVPKSLRPKLLVDAKASAEGLDSLMRGVLEAAFKLFPQCKQAVQEELSDEVQQYVSLLTKLGKVFAHQLILIPQMGGPFLEIYLFLFGSA